MALSLLHPGVYIEEVPSGVRTIAGVATSIALFIGWAPKGSVERAVRIHSFSDFKRYFIMFLVYMKVKMQGKFATSPKMSAIPNGPTAFGS